MPTSDDLLEIAGRCAERVDVDGKARHKLLAAWLKGEG